MIAAGLRSLQLKFSLGLAAISVLGIGLSTWYTSQQTSKTLLDLAEVKWSESTSVIANVAGGGLKWKKADVVKETYAATVNSPEQPVNRLLALSTSGEVVSEYVREGVDAAAIDEVIKREYAKAADGPQTVLLPGARLIIEAAPKGKDGKPQGYVGIAWRTDTIDAIIWSLARGNVLAQAVAMVVSLALLMFTMRVMITAPLSRISRRIGDFSTGNYGGKPLGTARRDEVGVIMKAVDDFRDAAARRVRERENINRAVEELAAALDRLSSGDLTRQIDTQFEGELDKLRLDWNKAVNKLEGAVTVIAANTSEVDTASTEIARAANELALRGERQAANLHETTTALRQVTDAVNDTVASMRLVGGAVTRAKQEATIGDDVTKTAIEAMSKIEESSQKISRITDVIDELSFQTNLLALNAGVEAARAGEEGKGFAVVAVEVRALSRRSAEAAEEIKMLIQESSTHVTEGVELVGSAGASLSRMVERVLEIDKLAQTVSAGAVEQATNLGKVNVAISSMDETMQQNAAMMEESNAATRRLDGAASQVAGLVRQFKISSSGGAAAPDNSLSGQQARVMQFAATGS